jgi:hypothetical protein
MLHYFGLDYGMLEFKYSTHAIVDSHTFMETGLAVKIDNPFAGEVGGLEVFLYEAAQNFEHL